MSASYPHDQWNSYPSGVAQILNSPRKTPFIFQRLVVTLGRQGASNVWACYTFDSEGLVGPTLKELPR